jgi:predicted nucleic acid-binding protein
LSAIVDTSVLVDYLRGKPEAAVVLEEQRATGPLFASEITGVELLAGMRPEEEIQTRALFAALTWCPLESALAELAGALGREWRPSRHNIDTADLIIAATAQLIDVPLLTLNVRHFPMFPGLRAPY